MAVWAADARAIYIRGLGLGWLCAATGHAVDISLEDAKQILVILTCNLSW